MGLQVSLFGPGFKLSRVCACIKQGHKINNSRVVGCIPNGAAKRNHHLFAPRSPFLFPKGKTKAKQPGTCLVTETGILFLALVCALVNGRGGCWE